MDAEFEWPSHNILTHTGLVRELYNQQVRACVNNYVDAIPNVQALYNSQEVQNHVFEQNEAPERTSNGIVHTVYKLPIPYYNKSTVIPTLIRNLRPLLTHACRVNVSIGFIHTRAEYNVYCYKYASTNTQLIPESLTVTRDDDLSKLAAYMEPARVYRQIDNNFLKSYRFQIVALVNVQILVWHSEQYKMGCHNDLVCAHQRLLQKRCVWTFSHEPNDNKCFFRALAAHKTQGGPRARLQKLTTELWSLAFVNGLCLPPPNQTFVDPLRTSELETLFQMHIRWYSIDNSLPPILYTNETYGTTAHILSIGEHCALITDVHQFFEQYFCEKCRRVYANRNSIYRHKQICKATSEFDVKKWKFKGGPERPRVDPFELLTAYDIAIDPALKFTPAFVAFDIECMLQTPTPNFFAAAQRHCILCEHIPVSIAAAYSGDAASVENPECFVSRGDAGELVDEFVNYLLYVHERHGREQAVRYKSVLDALSARIVTVEQYMPPHIRVMAHVKTDTPSKYRLRRALKQLLDIQAHVRKCAFRVVVLGYNSSAYDLNAMRAWLLPKLNNCDTKLHAIKRRNRYLTLETEKFKFTDMYLFLAAHTKLSDFIKAYTTVEDMEGSEFAHKREFPYEWMTNLSVLQDNALPEDKYWLASMSKYEHEKDGHARAQMMDAARERRARAQIIWERGGYVRMREYLIDYNKADVSPFIKAVRNYAQFYRNKGFDIFQFLTLPSLAKQTALAHCPRGAYFERFPEADAALYHQIRNSLYGGAAIVWTRLAEAGRTQIRPYEFGKHAQYVERIIGVDMTACYLWATCQEQPTGPYFVRHASDSYAIANGVTNIHAIMAIEYCITRHYGAAALERLTHRYRGGETQIITHNYHVYSVDGHLKLDDGSIIIVEYNGCYHHNHKQGCTLQHSNNEQHKPEAEAERLAILQTHAKKVHVIWECEWYGMLRQPRVISFISARPMYHTYSTRTGFSQQRALELVMQDKLKGIFELDAYVPSTHKHMFTDLGPFYYPTDITFDMIGPTMQNLLLSVEKQFEARRLLVNAPFCKNLLLPHQYVKWLIEHGIIIHTVHKIIEYPMCSYPFHNLGELICKERQIAARQEASAHEKAAGDTWKLLGNSVYGQFCMQPENYSVTMYVDANTLKQQLFKCKLRTINPLADNLFELTVTKSTVVVTQCPQMGFYVYALSKLRMLSFGYEWMAIMERALTNFVLTDTDSYYIALARKTWEECVRADVSIDTVREFKRQYFATEAAHVKYRGLFHIEFNGTLVIALQPKLYFAIGDNTCKLSARGVDKKENTLNVELFRNLLLNPPVRQENERQCDKLVQKTFRVIDNSMVTYRLFMSNINSFYIKRCVLPNKIDTQDLCWKWPLEFSL